MPRYNLPSAIKALKNLKVEASHSAILRFSAITIILLIAFTIRLLPMRWIPVPWRPDHFYLSAYDPYFQYRLTRHIVERGFLSWGWYDRLGWYPWGRDIAKVAYPGLPMTAAFFYLILKSLGVPVDLVMFCLLFPPIMGTITTLVIYYLGRDIGGEAVGLFSAFFLALSPSYISRTYLGFFDDETVGIFGILLFMLFFLRSIEREKPLQSKIIYAALSGLALGYLFGSWGAARYAVGIMILFVVTLLIIRRYSANLLMSYGICFLIALTISASVPKLGMGFLREATVMPVYGMFILLCIFEANRRLRTRRLKILSLMVSIIILAAAFLVLWSLGYFSLMGGKFLTTLNPFLRAASPLFESVAEHKISVWTNFYYDFGILTFLIPLGLFFAVKMATDKTVFLCIFGLTSIYFASSMVRLTLIMAPAVCLISALGLVRLTKPFVALLREKKQKVKRKVRFRAKMGREISAIFIIIIFALFTLNYVVGTDFSRRRGTKYPRAIEQAYTPTTISVSGMGFRPSSAVEDWIYALIWIRENLPPSPPDGPTVIASWWDYGYWIETVANRTTLADGATMNTTQIAQIAKMFMSPEDEAIKILKRYNVTHVLVFTTVDIRGRDYPWGEAGKFIWMIRIAHLNESKYGEYFRGVWQWSDYGKNTTLYKMMTYGKIARGIPNVQPVTLQHFKLVYLSKGRPVSGIYPLILIYEVKY